MNYKELKVRSSTLWAEIKALEQEYKRNLTQIKEIKERQSDISSQIQKKLDQIQKDGEKYQEFLFEKGFYEDN